VQFVRGQYMLADRVDQGAQQRAGGADPAGQKCPVEIDAFAGIVNRIKQFRRVSTRYDKLADSYCVRLACLRVRPIRENVN